MTALQQLHDKVAAGEAMQAAFPKRCKGGDIDPFNGECLWCGAPMGGVCQGRAKEDR